MPNSPIRQLVDALAPRAILRPKVPRPDSDWPKRQSEATQKATQELKALIDDARKREGAIDATLRKALSGVRERHPGEGPVAEATRAGASAEAKRVHAEARAKLVAEVREKLTAKGREVAELAAAAARVS